MPLNPAVDLLFLNRVYFLKNASLLNCVVVGSEWHLHQLVKAVNQQHRQHVNAKQSKQRHSSIITPHHHGAQQAATSLDAVVEKIAELLEKGGQSGDFDLVLGVVESFDCEVYEGILVPGVARVLVGVAAV